MIYPIKIDLVPLLKNLIEAIQPYAKANNIQLQMSSFAESLEIYYHPEIIIPDLTRLICRIITFTPQDFVVELDLPEQDYYQKESLLIKITNSGASLIALQNHILEEIKLTTTLNETENNSTEFQIKIPVVSYDESSGNEMLSAPESKSNAYYSPFHTGLLRHLKSHFTSIKNLEKSTESMSQRDAIFMKKVNAFILAHLDREGFDTVKLGRALALSRTQLYRRLKPIIGFSPAHYIRYVRLNKAKEFLNKEDLTVSEVAYKTGFASPSHFTRSFQNQFGFKPSEIRKLRDDNNRNT